MPYDSSTHLFDFTMVSLPSIHEILPEYTRGRLVPQRSHNSPDILPKDPHRLPPIDHLPTRNSIQSPPFPQSLTILAPVYGNGKSGASTPSLSPPKYVDMDYCRSTSSASPASDSCSDVAENPAYSFDVLRSDPLSRSLQHIASSTTFRNFGSSTSRKTPTTEGTTGHMPVSFALTAPSNAQPQWPVYSGRVIPPDMPGSEAACAGTTSSFPISSFAAKPSPGEGNTDFSDQKKKHGCPHCSRHFDRLSTLRIHMNTHTGATPFRCPVPTCGREFNVKSNMRRHLRGHSQPD